MVQTVRKNIIYECEVCGAASNKPQKCCGQFMKKKKDSKQDKE